VREDGTVEAKIKQWCPQCKSLVDATLLLTYKRYRLVADRSSCPACGLVLWDHAWDPSAPPMVYDNKRPKRKQIPLFGKEEE